MLANFGFGTLADCRLTPPRLPSQWVGQRAQLPTKEDRMAKVAFLGLGVMGFPMAGHLKQKGGHDVTVYNRTAAKAEQWVAKYGGKSAKTPKEAAGRHEFVMALVG